MLLQRNHSIFHETKAGKRSTCLLHLIRDGTTNANVAQEQVCIFLLIRFDFFCLDFTVMVWSPTGVSQFSSYCNISLVRKGYDRPHRITHVFTERFPIASHLSSPGVLKLSWLEEKRTPKMLKNVKYWDCGDISGSLYRGSSPRKLALYMEVMNTWASMTAM